MSRLDSVSVISQDEVSRGRAGDPGPRRLTMDAHLSVSELCRQEGLSAEALAERAGLELGRIQAILEGRWTPSPGERDKIAAVFQRTREQIAWGHKATVQHLYGHGPQFGRTP
jgi:helix-turn-helix protein